MPGPAVAALEVALDPAIWTSLGFTVGTDGSCQIGATAVRVTGPGPTGTPPLAAWELRAARAGPARIDGLATHWTAAPPPVGDRHPNTAVAIDHVVVNTPDPGRTFAALQGVGMTLRRERTGTTGGRPLRQGFFRHGETIVEVVGPAVPSGDGPATFWGLTVVVGDLDVAVKLLGDRAGTARDAVQPGRRIVTVRAQACGGLPLAFMDGSPPMA